MVTQGTSSDSTVSPDSSVSPVRRTLYSYYSDDGEEVPPIRCHCGDLLQINTAMTIENRFRRYVGCEKWQEQASKNCGFYAWIDQPFPYQCRRVIGELYENNMKLVEHITDVEADLAKTKTDLEFMTTEFMEAKGFAEYLSEIDVQNQKQLRHLKEADMKLKRRWMVYGILYATATVILAVLIQYFK